VEREGVVGSTVTETVSSFTQERFRVVKMLKM